MAENEARARVLSSFYPPRHHVLIRHLLADPPPSSGDDVIYEQPLREASSLLGNQWLEQFMTEQCYHRWYT